MALIVAPHAGAWIETRVSLSSGCSWASRTPRGCVDRNRFNDRAEKIGSRRTPRGCVDRTPSFDKAVFADTGRTPRGCVDRNLLRYKALTPCEAGRTPRGCVDRNMATECLPTLWKLSHPTRVRGSKQCLKRNCQPVDQVAPHAGAWIETGLTASIRPSRKGRTPRGCVDRNVLQGDQQDAVAGRTPRGCVDRNRLLVRHQELISCRTPRGCVDRNPKVQA